jgi:hypothetical protein
MAAKSALKTQEMSLNRADQDNQPNCYENHNYYHNNEVREALRSFLHKSLPL